MDAIFEIWAYCWLPSGVQFWSLFWVQMRFPFRVQFWFHISPEPLNDSFSFDFGVRLWTQKSGSTLRQNWGPVLKPKFKVCGARFGGGSLSLVKFLVTGSGFHTCSMFDFKEASAQFSSTWTKLLLGCISVQTLAWSASALPN